MKKLIVVILLAYGVWHADRKRLLPLQERVDAMIGRPSAPLAAFQEFATALALGRIADLDKWTDDEAIKKEASTRYLDMRRSVSVVHRVSFRLESMEQAVTGKHVTLTVSEGMTVDPPGVSAGFGSLFCEGIYEVGLTDTPSGWKVNRLVARAPTAMPQKKRGGVWHRAEQVEWPCSDSAWTAFVTNWNAN